MKKLIIIPAIVGILFLADGCKKKLREDQNQTVTTSRATNVAEILKVEVRPDRVPNLTWKDAGGNMVDFDHFRGKVTLINFWATWCVPCKRELPDLVALSKELAGKDVKLLGISTDRGGNVIEEVGTFLREHDIPYQNLISNDAVEEAFGNITGIPTTFLVDADGKIVQKYVGGRSKEFLTQAITELLR